MRVTFVDHCARLSGAELALLRLCEGGSGFTPHVILGESGPLADELARAGIEHEVLPAPPHVNDFDRRSVGVRAAVLGVGRDTWAHARRVHSAVAATRPDVVVTNSMKAHVLYAAGFRKGGTPWVAYLRDRLDPRFMSRQGVHAMRLLLGVRPSALVSNSASTQSTVRIRWPGQARAVIPSPVDLPRGGELRETGSTSAREYVSVARLTPWKGQDLVIEAFARIFDGSQRLRIVGSPLFGEQQYARALEERVERLGLSDAIEFTGFRSDVYAILRTADVFVHSARIPEPLGQVVVQALAAGVPVVAADSGGVVETLRGGEAGLLYPTGDLDGLTSALRAVQADYAAASRRVPLGREIAAGFEKGCVARRFEAFLAGVAS